MSLSDIYDVVRNVRMRYFDDIVQYILQGYSEHDCVEINEEVCKELKKRGYKCKLVRLYRVKHYIVEIYLGDKALYADACPELSGLFNAVLPGGFVGDEKDVENFYR